MKIENLTFGPIHLAPPVQVATGEKRITSRVEKGQLVYSEEEIKVTKGASFDDEDKNGVHAITIPGSDKLNDPKSVVVSKALYEALDKGGILKPLIAGKMIRVVG